MGYILGSKLENVSENFRRRTSILNKYDIKTEESINREKNMEDRTDESISRERLI